MELIWPESNDERDIAAFVSDLRNKVSGAEYLYFVPYPKAFETAAARFREHFGPPFEVQGESYALDVWMVKVDRLEDACREFFSARLPELVVIAANRQLEDIDLSRLLSHETESDDETILFFSDNEIV